MFTKRVILYKQVKERLHLIGPLQNSVFSDLTKQTKLHRNTQLGTGGLTRD